MEAAKMLVIYWHEKGHDAIRVYQKLSTCLGHAPAAYQWSRIDSESSSEATISLDAHQASADSPMIISTL
jgi:hypothetical protein